MPSSTIPPAAARGYDDLPALLALLRSDAKHDPSAASTIDVHWVLYDRILRVAPETADDPERDRLLLSKGHGPASFYAVLAAKGFLPADALAGFGGFDSPLGHHPDAALIAGVEIASGSLGHGLPIAVGRALALRATGRSEPRVVCVLGDGELAEGSNHEAIALAGRLGLERLLAVVVDNGSATYGWPGGIAGRFASEGWTTASARARDHDALEHALLGGSPGRPHAVVARVEA
ncbi:MAG TPA: thiamine pyrophosphate-dependent enzyme [Gaiellales bacterium]|jgi:transketolase